MALGADTHTHTHTHIPMCKPKQFQETRYAWPQATRTWFNKTCVLNYIIIIDRLNVGDFVHNCQSPKFTPLPIFHHIQYSYCFVRKLSSYSCKLFLFGYNIAKVFVRCKLILDNQSQLNIALSKQAVSHNLSQCKQFNLRL